MSRAYVVARRIRTGTPIGSGAQRYLMTTPEPGDARPRWRALLTPRSRRIGSGHGALPARADARSRRTLAHRAESPERAARPRGRREHLGGDVARRVRAREAGRGVGHRGEAGAVAEQRVDLARRRAGVSSASADHDRRAARRPSSGRWRSGGRRTRADTGSGPPAGRTAASSKTEPPARATTRSAAASASPNGVEVLAQVVARRRARAQRREVARRRRRAGRGTARRRTPRRAASLIERAPSEPPKTSTHGLVRRRCRSRARARGAVGRPAAARGGR